MAYSPVAHGCSIVRFWYLLPQERKALRYYVVALYKKYRWNFIYCAIGILAMQSFQATYAQPTEISCWCHDYPAARTYAQQENKLLLSMLVHHIAQFAKQLIKNISRCTGYRNTQKFVAVKIDASQMTSTLHQFIQQHNIIGVLC